MRTRLTAIAVGLGVVFAANFLGGGPLWP